MSNLLTNTLHVFERERASFLRTLSPHRSPSAGLQKALQAVDKPVEIDCKNDAPAQALSVGGASLMRARRCHIDARGRQRDQRLQLAG
nr:hypothetical protein [uncultured Cupriavidus sp.]